MTSFEDEPSLVRDDAIRRIPAEAHNSAYSYMKPEARRLAEPRKISDTYRIPKTQYGYQEHGDVCLPKKTCVCCISENCMDRPEGQLDCRSLAPGPKKSRSSSGCKSGRRIDTKIRKHHDELVRSIKYFDILSQDLRHNDATCPPLPLIYRYMRKWIGDMRCFSMTRPLLIGSNILHILREFLGWVVANYDNYRRVPLDILNDLEWLKRKWRRGDWDLGDCLRGIHVDLCGGRSLDKDWRFYKSDWRQFGKNGLIVGETWPHQIAIMRDGGHGAPEAGISGVQGEGATSLVLSNPEQREDYADIDEGDKIRYVSTSSRTTRPTRCSELLMASYEWYLLCQKLELEASDEKEDKKTRKLQGRPVRLFRSWRLSEKNKWRPRSGFRYDGLYDVVDYEVIDPAHALFRFTLERQVGQGEIRVDQPDDQTCLLYYQAAGVQKAAKRKNCHLIDGRPEEGRGFKRSRVIDQRLESRRLVNEADVA